MKKGKIGRFEKKKDKEGEVKEVPVLTFHDLRHTFGTTCAAAGIPLRTIMEWMGHKDIKTTMIYSHYAPSDQEAELIERAFKPKSITDADDLLKEAEDQSRIPTTDSKKLGATPPGTNQSSQVSLIHE